MLGIYSEIVRLLEPMLNADYIYSFCECRLKSPDSDSFIPCHTTNLHLGGSRDNLLAVLVEADTGRGSTVAATDAGANAKRTLSVHHVVTHTKDGK